MHGLMQDETSDSSEALERRRWEQRVEERTRELVRRQQVAESLRNMLAVLNSGQPLEVILDHIVAEASSVLNAEAVAIYRLQDDRSMLTIQAAQGLEPGYVEDARIPVGQSVTGQAVLEHRPVALSDIAGLSSGDDIPLDHQRRVLLERLGTRYRALIAVPLETSEVYGAITLYYGQPRAFSEEDVGLAVAFGDQAALAIQNAQLRRQVEQAAVASERRRLAHDLHDSVTQVLFSASLTAEVLPVVWQRDRQEGERALEDLRQLTRGALAEMRMLLLELRPDSLRQARLEELLHQLAEAVAGRARIPVDVEIEGCADLPSEVRVALYRIAQEALNNVARHAEANRAVLSLRCEAVAPVGSGQPASAARLEVCDDGIGFGVDTVSAEHLGLAIMRERAEAIGAELSISSEPGQGARVIAVWRDHGDGRR